MRPWIRLGATALFLAPLCMERAAAQSGPGVETGPTSAAQANPDLAREVKTILADYQSRVNAFWEAYKAAESEQAQQELIETTYPRPEDCVARLKPIVEQAPADPAALTAIDWVVSNADAREDRTVFLDALLEHHSTAPQIGDICWTLSRDVSSESGQFLRKLMKGAGDRATAGQATFALAGVLDARVSLHENLGQADQGTAAALVRYYGSGTVALCRPLDVEALGKEREQLWVAARDRYGNVPWRNTTLGQAATRRIFEAENLQVGMVAPDIAGQDLDGVDFRLSDYRGRVVLLDFWGDW